MLPNVQRKIGPGPRFYSACAAIVSCTESTSGASCRRTVQALGGSGPGKKETAGLSVRGGKYYGRSMNESLRRSSMNESLRRKRVLQSRAYNRKLEIPRKNPHCFLSHGSRRCSGGLCWCNLQCGIWEEEKIRTRGRGGC